MQISAQKGIVMAVVKKHQMVNTLPFNNMIIEE